MSSKLRHISMFSGNTILGDGSVIMIIDPNGIADAVGSVGDAQVTGETEGEQEANSEQTISLLVFRAGSQELKAVPLSLITRLEEIACSDIELSNGRHLIQYRGRLMPLVPVNDAVLVKSEGVQPILVFSDEGRSTGLVVDEIVDIVADKLAVEVASETPGVVGSAIIKGKATEIIDIGHFFEDWLQRKEPSRSALAPSLLLVDDSAFFRNLLSPVLQAAGYRAVTVASAEEALTLLKKGQAFEAIISDIQMPGMNGMQFAEAVRRDERTAAIPMIALSSHATPALLEQVRKAGFRDFVAKFDRPGLIAAIKEMTIEWDQAA